MIYCLRERGAGSHLYNLTTRTLFKLIAKRTSLIPQNIITVILINTGQQKKSFSYNNIMNNLQVSQVHKNPLIKSKLNKSLY